MRLFCLTRQLGLNDWIELLADKCHVGMNHVTMEGFRRMSEGSGL